MIKICLLTSSLIRLSNSWRAFFTASSRPTIVMISRSFVLLASESEGKTIRAPVNSRIFRMLEPFLPIKNLIKDTKRESNLRKLGKGIINTCDVQL